MNPPSKTPKPAPLPIAAATASPSSPVNAARAPPAAPAPTIGNRIVAAPLTGVSRPLLASAVPNARALDDAPSAAAILSPAPRRPRWVAVRLGPPDTAPASPTVSMAPPRPLVAVIVLAMVPSPGTFIVIGRPAASPKVIPVVPLAMPSCTAWPICSDPVTPAVNLPAMFSGTRPRFEMRSPAR